MIVLLLSALLMGAAGSLHCIGMCGPLALSLPVVQVSHAAKFVTALLYNLGRVTTYTALGAAVGLLGASFSMFGFQQWLSVGLGVVILIYLLLPKQSLYVNGHNAVQKIFALLRSKLAALFKKKNYSAVFFIGLLNGLLPCGLLYMALAAAIATGSVAKSSLFMMAFGAGTLPLMWALVFFGSFVSLKLRATIRKAHPYLLFAMACLLIVRGLGLGIPYLSPEAKPGSASTSIECHTAIK